MRARTGFVLIVLLVLLVLLVSGPAARAQEYTAVRITSPHGSVSVAAMNELGQLAGEIFTATQAVPFLYSGGAFAEYPQIAGIAPNVTGLNNAGTLVGYYMFNNGGLDREDAFVLQNGHLAALGTLGGDSSSADAIDDTGRIVGWTDTFVLFQQAMLYANGHEIDLGTLQGGGVSGATAINANGQIAGYSQIADPSQSGTVLHAILQSGGVMSDLGSLGGPHRSSIAQAINAGGTVVGYSDTAASTRHAVAWSGGQMVDLGTLGGANSIASGINLAGDIVGSSDVLGSADTHAFVRRKGVMVDLNSLVTVSGDTLVGAGSINAAGQIVAYGRNVSYLLNPIQTNRFAYAWAFSPTNAASYTADPAYSYNAAGGPINIQHIGAGNYSVEFVGFAFGPGVSSSVAVTAFGSSTITCTVLPYATSFTSAAVNVACHDMVTWQPADTLFDVLILGNGSLPIPSAFVTSEGGPAPVPPPDPQSVWTTGRLPVTVTHNAPVGDYSVLFGTGNTPLAAKLVTSTGGASQCTYAEGVSGGIRVRCYSFGGALMDSGFSVLQVGGARTGRRLGFATANLSTTASYTPAANSAFNSTGGAITATRSSVGRYRMAFTGLQRFPGHTENVQVQMIGTLPYSCNATGWGNLADALFVNVECRNQAGQFVDVRYNVLVIE